jgi:predicted HTH domain antitoxin
METKIIISDTIVHAMRLPEEKIKEELLKELSISLYARGILSFGKARELAGLEKFEFGKLLGERNIPRHYGYEDLEDDLLYANS